MGRIELAPEVLDELDRFLDHMTGFDAVDIPERMGEIIEAIQVLAQPSDWPTVKDGQRELVIGKGVRGSVALYRYLAEVETVSILAIRAQREAGFTH